MSIFVPRLSALGPRSPYRRPSVPKILQDLNTIILFNSEVVITLKLQTKYFVVFILIINDVESKKLIRWFKSTKHTFTLYICYFLVMISAPNELTFANFSFIYTAGKYSE